MTDDECFDSAVRRRAFELSQAAEAGTPAENWLRAEREHRVAHEYDTVDRDLEQLGLTIARLPSEAGVGWRLTLARGEQFEAWEPGTSGLSPPDELKELLGGVLHGKELIPSAPAGSDPSVVRLRQLLAAQRQALRAHDPGVRLGAESDNLRKHRVAARRSRAFLRATRAYTDPEWRRSLAGPLRRLAEVTGPVRDLDVLVGRLQVELRQLEPPDSDGAATLVAGLVGKREVARRELLEALDDGRYHLLLGRLHLPPRLRAGVDSIPLKRIARREFHALQTAVARLGKDPGDSALHGLRITLKRARYAAELSAPENKTIGAFLAAAKTLQDLLGEHQDAVMAESLLRSASVVDRPTAAAFAAGRLAERQVARRAVVHERLPAAWRRLRKRGSRL